MNRDYLVLERLLPASIERVWKSISEPEELKYWFFNLEEFRPEVGFRFSFTAGHKEETQYLHICEVIEVIPLKKLSYSWRYEGYHGRSVVTIELQEQNEKTLLRLTHTGISSFPKDNPNFLLRNFEEGWSQLIDQSLNKYLNMKHYTKKLTVPVSDEKLFKSILNIPLWWSEMFEGTANAPGDRFTVRFGPSVHKTSLVEEIIPYRRITWNVVDAYVNIPELHDKTEWIGTKIIWEISPAETGCELKFTHMGLTPDVECYTICENGWNNFLQSLIAYTTSGTGTPYKEA